MRGVRNLIIALVYSLVMPGLAFGNGISCSDEATLRSAVTGRPATITFVNNSHHSANIYWIDYAGKRAQHFNVAPGSVISRNSSTSAPWIITDDLDKCIGAVYASPSTPNVEITDAGIVFPRIPDAVEKHDDSSGQIADMSRIWSTISIFSFGVVFIISILLLAFVFPEPTAFQYTVCRIILALAASGVATLLPGTLDVKIPGYLTASAAFAVFVIVYFRTPANLVVADQSRHNESHQVRK